MARTWPSVTITLANAENDAQDKTRQLNNCLNIGFNVLNSMSTQCRRKGNNP
ncbi:hypothetical protein TUM4637_09210 [Shewanella hafniensis]|nr:hypothetical protein TUM4637_09210 [Shewanella hafniensis]